MKTNSKRTSKGFKWTGWLKSDNSVTPSEYVVYKGNFVMELELPNALKIRGFRTLKDRLEKYLNEHSGKFPTAIRCTRKQYCQYEDLFIGQIRKTDKYTNLVFQGVPMIRYAPR